MSTLGTPGCGLSATSFISSCLAWFDMFFERIFFKTCFDKMIGLGTYQILQDQIKVMMLFQIKLDDVIVLVGSSNLVYPKAPETIWSPSHLSAFDLCFTTCQNGLRIGKMASKAMAVGPHNTHLEAFVEKVMFQGTHFQECLRKVWKSCLPFQFLLPNMADDVGQVPSVNCHHCRASAPTPLLACWWQSSKHCVSSKM